MNTQLTTINPFELLDELFELDEIAAVRIANKWGGMYSEITDAQYNAAWAIIERQTVFPICISCRWAVIDDDPHPTCEAELRSPLQPSFDYSPQDLGDMDEVRCGGDRPGLMVDDVPDDFIEYDEVDYEDEDPIASDVDPNGGYYEPPTHPFDAHRLNVMRQYGDYTG